MRELARRGGVTLLGMVAVAAVGAALAACGSSKSATGATANSAATGSKTGGAASGKAFRVLVVADLSGATKVYGAQELLGMKAAAAYWNAHGGIGGRQIAVSSADDTGDAATAVTQLVKWVQANGSPDMVYPGSTGVDNASLTPAVKRMNLLAVGVDETHTCVENSQQACPTFFSPNGQDKYQPVAAASWIKQHGYKKVGLLVSENAFSTTQAPIVVKALNAQGIKTVEATFPQTAVDVSPELLKLKEAHADAVFVAALGPSFGYVFRARAKLGLVDSLPLLLNESAAGLDVTTLAPAAQLKNSWEETQRSGVPSVKIPGRDLLLQAAGPLGKISPVFLGAFEWDDLLAVHDAAAQAHATDRDSLIKALNNLDDKYVHDPLWMNSEAVKFNEQVHENVLDTASANVIVGTGPLVNGMIQPQG